MKKLLLLFIYCFVGLCSHAQNEQEKINEIKKNLNFLYATGTSMNSPEEASDNAKELLFLEIEQWLKNFVQDDYLGYITKAKNNLLEITTKKGKLFRSFIYVQKVDILPYYKDEIIMTSYQEEISSNSSTKQINKDTNSITQQTSSKNVLTSKEKELLNITNLSAINNYITQGLEKKEVLHYGKYDDNTKLFGKSYLFLINKEGTVIAVLCKNGSVETDLSTGLTTNIKSYGRCGVIWIQLNK